MQTFNIMRYRVLTLVAMLLASASCVEQPKPSNPDVVGLFHERNASMNAAMESGDVERAAEISRETNAWLESLSDEEQTLISRSLIGQ